MPMRQRNGSPSRTNTCVMTLARQSMKRKTCQDTEGVADEKDSTENK